MRHPGAHKSKHQNNKKGKGKESSHLRQTSLTHEPRAQHAIWIKVDPTGSEGVGSLLSRIYTIANNGRFRPDYYFITDSVQFGQYPAGFQPTYVYDTIGPKADVWASVLEDGAISQYFPQVSVGQTSQSGKQTAVPQSFEMSLRHAEGCSYDHAKMRVGSFAHSKSESHKHTLAQATSYGMYSGVNFIYQPKQVEPKRLVELKVQGDLRQIAATLEGGLGPKHPPNLAAPTFDDTAPTVVKETRFCTALIGSLSICYMRGIFQYSSLPAAATSSQGVEDVLSDPYFDFTSCPGPSASM